MPLLRTKVRKRPRHTFILKLPVESLRYLSLYSMAKGLSRTKIIRDVIGDWIDENKVEETEDVLIEQVVDRVDEVWYGQQKLARSCNEPEPDFNAFMDELEAEVTRKDSRYARKQKIDPEIAEKIIDRVYEKNREFLK